MKVRQILAKVDTQRRISGARFSPILMDFKAEKGIFEWETRGETGVYRQVIQIDPKMWGLKSVKDLFISVKKGKKVPLSMEDAIEMFKKNNHKLDILVYCDCPSFLYHGYAYIATKLGFGVKREMRPPRIRNPRLKGSVCKHLVAVLTELV